jgi:type IV pilus assembly protein PilB
MAQRIGEILVDRGYISKEQLIEALDVQQQRGGKLGNVIMQMGLISEQQIIDALSTQFGIPIIDLVKTQTGIIPTPIVPQNLARRLMVLPLWERNGILTIVITDPTRLRDLEEIRAITGCEIEPYLATASAVIDAMDRPYWTLQMSEEFQRLVEELEAPAVRT